MQQPESLSRPGRPRRMWQRIGGTLERTSASFRRRISRTLPRRLCKARNKCRTRAGRNQIYPLAKLRRSGTTQDIRYTAGCSPSSSLDRSPAIQRGIGRTSVSTANTPRYNARLSDLKLSSDPPLLFFELLTELLHLVSYRHEGASCQRINGASSGTNAPT